MKIPLEFDINLFTPTLSEIGRIYCKNGSYYPIHEEDLKDNPLLASILSNAMADVRNKFNIILNKIEDKKEI